MAVKWFVKSIINACHLLVIIFVFYALSVSADGISEKIKNEEVRDLRYGVVLYQYYQKRYLDALVELRVSNELGDIHDDSMRADQMEGGIALLYGMSSRAEVVLIDKLPGDSSQKDMALSYLAKSAYEEGNDELVISINGLMRADKEEKIANQMRYYQSSIKMDSVDIEDEELYELLIPSDSIWRYYYLYDLGSFELDNNNYDEGIGVLNKLVKLPIISDEAKKIINRAELTLGFTYFRLNNFRAAEKAFVKVSNDSYWLDQAMLGYGWSLAYQGKYVRAINVWNELSQRRKNQSAVQESYIAIAYGYEQLDKKGAAINRYKDALHKYTTINKEIAENIEFIENTPLNNIIDIYVDGETDWVETSDRWGVNSRAAYIDTVDRSMEVKSLVKMYMDYMRLITEIKKSKSTIHALDGSIQRKLTQWASSGVIERARLVDKKYRDLEDGIKDPSIEKRLFTVSDWVSKYKDDTYKNKLVKLQNQYNQLENRANVHIGEIEKRIKVIAINSLKSQNNRIDRYTRQAKLSMTRLYDSLATSEPTSSEAFYSES